MNLLLHGLEAPQIAYGNTLDRASTKSATASAWTSSSPTRPSAARKKPASRPTSRPTCRRRKPRCCSCNTSCASCAWRALPGAGRQSLPSAVAAPPWSCPTAPCLAMASAPSSRRNAQGVPPAHHRAPAARRVRALHRHPGQPAVLRARRPHRHHLVLRTAAARRPQEVQQDRAAAVRGIRPGPGLVECPRRRPAGLEGGLCRQARAAVEAATPHWQRAEAERNAAIAWASPSANWSKPFQAAANGRRPRCKSAAALKASSRPTNRPPSRRRPKAMRCTGRSTTWTSRTPTPRRAWNTPTRKT
jgi:hypothetical protein